VRYDVDMAKTVDELTVNWTENGALKVRELDKVVLSTSTSWATVAFLFQEADADAAGQWRAPKVSIRRYRKRGGKLHVDKHLTLSTEKQALDFAAAVTSWFAEGGAGRTHTVQPASMPSPNKVGDQPTADEA
jgi:hypothetical protein